jgi:hypothetical protein
MVYHRFTHLSLFAWLLDTSMIPNKEGVFLSTGKKMLVAVLLPQGVQTNSLHLER